MDLVVSLPPTSWHRTFPLSQAVFPHAFVQSLFTLVPGLGQLLICFLSIRWQGFAFSRISYNQHDTIRRFLHLAFLLWDSTMMLYVSHLFIFIVEYYSFIWVYHNLLSIHSLWTFGLFPIRGYYEHMLTRLCM